MSHHVPGLHHVTAITGEVQPNVDFYVGPLRQRLVKKTVNFDDPGTYHLYYGNAEGAPGTILTFFPFAGARQGRAGHGMTESFAYAVPETSLDGWAERLRGAGVTLLPEEQRFGDRVLPLRDPDGQKLELVGTAGLSGDADDGFHSVTLWLRDPGPTARILTTVFGYEEAGHESAAGQERLRLVAKGGGRASVVDLLRVDDAPRAQPGAGTIHHVAFRALDDAMQNDLREALSVAGMQVTPQIDRQYFNAIYFREPGGILFEVATDPPGFAVDEAPEALGRSLKLPPQYEGIRARIEASLPPLRVPE
ncbi:ring-cleaving dioxygenase [Halodurantibacterium flavum]|uniref:Ring-cleaving dioxygenase n=1 Tax=Halodurantibacterium flavum TaxID=1382802 RepID=A0ABW4S9N4_9RHOB